MYNKPTLNHHHQTALLYLYNNPDQPAFTGPNNQALNELRQMGYVKAKKFENWAGTGHLRMEWTLTKAGIERVEVGFLGKCAACKGIGQTLLRGKCTVCNGRGQGWISEWSQKPIEDNPQIAPKFEKTDANRLADAIEEIGRLEKALAESEKRGSELAASYCDGVVGDEYGHPYCRYKVERDAALARVAELEGKLTDWVHEGFRLNEALAVAKAQPSVPEISGIGRDAEHPRAVVLYLRNEPSEEDMRAIQNFLRAISADVLTQAQHSAGYAEARQCVNCRHIGINDAADYAACHDCRWTGPEPDEDKCPGCAGENCMAAACPECGGRYELVAEAKISTPAAQAGQVPQAWLDVQAERRRQVEAEGWTPEHDDAHSHGQMARAAACYALAGSSAPNDGTAALLVSLAWPWDEQWWKPTSARRDLVKACALGLAEIERLDRAAASQGGPSDA